MRMLNWVQNKLSGKQEKKRFDPVASSSFYDRKEEFSDWPQALLAIGTFGNNEFKEKQKRHCSTEDDDFKDEDPQTLSLSGNSETFQESPDFTLEEVSKLQNELTKLLALKPKTSTGSGIEGERPNFPLNRYLNCPSSLEVDRIACEKICDDIQDNEGGDLSPKSKIILMNKAKDILTDKPNAISRRSISFLLKKIFTCRRGCPPVPTIRDSIPESRTEKLLRMILHKKIYPQSSTPTSVKYLEKKSSKKRREGKDGKLQEKEEGCKWVKTDSEFIVLEM